MIIIIIFIIIIIIIIIITVVVHLDISELRIYWQGVRFFGEFKNTIHKIRWYDKSILALKISVTSFADFGIKVLFLGQNNFEWIASVGCCVF